MGAPAAKLGDKVVGVDMHIIMNPSPGGPVPTPTPHPFNGIISGGCVATVQIMGMPAAVMGSTADNLPPHLPIGAGPFQIPPTNKATISKGSATVSIGGKPAARAGDMAMTCTDLPPMVPAQVVAVSTVMIGG